MNALNIINRGQAKKQYMYLFTGMVLDELTDCETQA